MSELKIAGEKLVEWMHSAPVGSVISRHNPPRNSHWVKQPKDVWEYGGKNAFGRFPSSFWSLSNGFWYCFSKFQVEEECDDS